MADSTDTETKTGSLVANEDAETHGIVTEIADKDGKIYDIAAKRFANSVTVELTGGVTGKVDTWDGKSTLTIANTIPKETIVTDKIADKNVTTAKLADGAVTLAKVSSDAIGTSVAESTQSGLLATQGAVKTYVDAQVAGKGSYLGKMTVAAVNALDASALHNGDRLMVSGTGTIVHGEGGQPYEASDGEDFILYKVSDTEYEWQSIDGNFKLKGTQQDWSDKLGGTQIITNLSQDADGNLTVEAGSITSASSADAGIAKLYDTTGSATDGSVTQKLVTDELAKKQDSLSMEGTYDATSNKVATVSSVTTRIEALDAEVTSSDSNNVQVKVTEVDGKVTAVTVSDASAKASDLTAEIKARGDADTTLQGNIDAEAKARGDADSALDTRVKSLEGVSHTHSNKTVLDGITETKVSNWDDAYSKEHTHENKDILDGITETKVSNWDAAYADSHTHTQAQKDAMDSGVTSAKVTGYDTHVADGDIHVTKAQKEAWTAKQDKLTNTDTEIQTAVSQSHVHTDAQKSAMDSGITSAKVTGYDAHLLDGDVHVTKAQKEAWTAKQDSITDLDTIRSGAAKGATATQPGDKLSTLTDDITVDTYSSTGEAPISGKGVKAAIDELDAEVTSTTAGANVQVKVTQTDGKITAVSIASDSTATAQSVTDEATARSAADVTLQQNIDKKQDTLQVEYDAKNTRLTFKNVSFTVVENV